MAKRSNTRFASSVSTVDKPSKASWNCLDAMPRNLKQAIWEAPVSINPLSVEDLVLLEGARAAIVSLGEAAAGEIAAFSAEHQMRYGYALPHVAAKAQPQRYGAFAKTITPKTRQRRLVNVNRLWPPIKKLRAKQLWKDWLKTV